MVIGSFVRLYIDIKISCIETAYFYFVLIHIVQQEMDNEPYERTLKKMCSFRDLSSRKLYKNLDTEEVDIRNETVFSIYN